MTHDSLTKIGTMLEMHGVTYKSKHLTMASMAGKWVTEPDMVIICEIALLIAGTQGATNTWCFQLPQNPKAKLHAVQLQMRP